MKLENVPTLIEARLGVGRAGHGKNANNWRYLRRMLSRHGGVPDRPLAFPESKTGYWIAWLPTGEVVTTKLVHSEGPQNDRPSIDDGTGVF